MGIYHKQSESTKLELIKEKLLSQRIIMSSGCWFWPTMGYKGYGQVRFKGEKWRVHRLSMFLFKPTEFDSNLDVLHKCNQERCFNPEHLYSGTQAENTLDSVEAGTHNSSSKTQCPRGHEYTEENTYVSPGSNKRRCVACRKLEAIQQTFKRSVELQIKKRSSNHGIFNVI